MPCLAIKKRQWLLCFATLGGCSPTHPHVSTPGTWHLLPGPPPTTDWDARQEDPQNQKLWEQDWDDDNTNDDFSRRLKAELAKQQQQAAPK